MTLKNALLRVICAVGFAYALAATANNAPHASLAHTDIGADFNAFWQAAQNEPFERQLVLWDEWIEGPRRDLYNTIVWAAPQRPDAAQRVLRERFKSYAEIAERIAPAAREFRTRSTEQVARFAALFPDAQRHPPIELLLAPNFDAKSGVRADGKPVLVFAIDTLVLAKSNYDVLFPHELFHLYHANRAGIRNDGVMPGVTLALPLFAEGLATYVSSQVAPDHSDGELLLQNDLAQIAHADLPKIAGSFLADAQFKAIDDEHPEAFKRWFYGGRKPFQPCLPNRSGYWLGLQLIRQLREHHSLREIAGWNPAQAEQHTLAALHEMAGPRPQPLDAQSCAR